MHGAVMEICLVNIRGSVSMHGAVMEICLVNIKRGC